MMARTMELSLDEMSELGLKWKNDVVISNMCTVFAESEVVSLVAQDTPPEDIIHGLNNSVAGKTISLVKRLGGEKGYIMTGGVAKNRGIVEAIEEKLGEKLFVCDEAQLCGAIGAALIGLDSLAEAVLWKKRAAGAGKKQITDQKAMTITNVEGISHGKRS